MVSESLREHSVLWQLTFKCVIADCALRSLKPDESQTLRNIEFSSNFFFELEKQAYETL